MWAENEPIYPAPRNAVREHGRKRGYGGQNRLVLARLVWPSGAVVVPARLLWVDDDVVCVEWQRPANLVGYGSSHLTPTNEPDRRGARP